MKISIHSTQFSLSALVVAAALALAPAPATADTTEISPIPLGTASSVTVLPNLMFILDDSGSMQWHFMPDNVNFSNTNSCKSYIRRSSGSAVNECAAATFSAGTLPNPDTDTVSPSSDNLRHDPAQIWFVGPPAMAAQFNTIYYNPQITYSPGMDTSGVQRPNQTPTAVQNNPYAATPQTFSIVDNYPEPVFCTATGSTPTDNTACRRNGYAADGITLHPSFRYSNASAPGNGTFGWPEGTGSGAARYLRMRFGGPFYYTILAREYCSDVDLINCVLATTPGTNPSPATTPFEAPVRYCTTTTLANQTAVVTGGSPASCQAKIDGTHRSLRYGQFVRTNIDPAVTTYAGRPNRTDCAAKPICTYNEELINFANWYAFYHTRMQTMKTTAGRTFAPMDDRYRIGFVTINAGSASEYLKIDKFDTVQKTAWFTKFYAQTPSGGTPLRQGLARVGRHYAGQTDGINSFMPEDPIQFSCQQNFALLTTDGYWNGAGGVKVNGTTAMDNQDNPEDTAAPVWVNRPTGTLDGFGTTVTTSNSTVDLEQVICTGAATANFSGALDTPCGCSGSLKRVKERRLENFNVTSSKDGIDNPPTSSQNATFTDVTACNAAVRTLVERVQESERVVCSGNNTTNFSGTAETTCGCTSTNKRIKQRVRNADRTTLFIDGVAQTPTYGNFGSATFSNVVGIPPNGTLLGACVSSGTTLNPTATSYAFVSTVSDTTTGATITAADITLTPNPTTGIPGTTSVNTSAGGFSNTLADVAMYYYKTDLRTTGALSITKNNVPTTTKDGASHQHMVTFTLGLGLDGVMNYRSDYETAGSGDFHRIRSGLTGCSWSPAGASAICNWPQPIQDSPSALDDLWHAAVNGRGLYFSAKDPNSLQAGITTTLNSIKVTTGAAAASATSTPNITPTDNFIYSSTYRTLKWDGEIVAEKIDPVAGTIIPGIAWSAMTKLDARVGSATDTRNIFTFDGSDASRKLKEFRYGKLSGTEAGYFDNVCTNFPSLWPQCAPLSGGDLDAANSGDNLVNYLRGQTQHEGRQFRDREHALGDTVNAKPAFVGKPNLLYGDAVTPDYGSFKAGPAKDRAGILYISANDGMLHAFDGGDSSSGGEEVWAYVPKMLLAEMFKLGAFNYDVNHRFYVDGSPAAMDVFDRYSGTWRTILVGGLNAGGRGYYALDITDPTATGVKALWEFCADASLCDISDKDLGFSFGVPVITKRAVDGRWVAIVTSGYNNVTPGDGGGWLYVLDAITGEILSKTGTEISGANVGDTTTPSGFAKISGFSLNFTVNNTTTFVYGGDLLGNIWRFDMQTDPPSVQRIGQALDGSSPPRPQSITTRPEITRFDAGFNVVYVGTGRYLGASDIPDARTLPTPPVPTWAYQQSVYAVKDTGTDLGSLRAPAANLQVQEMKLIDSVSRTISNNKVDWDTMNGWYVDLNPSDNSPGERINIDMQLVRGVLVVAANEPNDEACSTGGNSFLYFFDYKSGSYVASSPGGVVGTRLSTALAAGFVVYRLANGQLKFAEINVNGTKKVGGVPPGSGGALGRRVSWRELF
jgi:Tfp pilus tip-associated adhesin PilY1